MKIINKTSDIDTLSEAQVRALAKELFIVQATLRKHVGKGDIEDYICKANTLPDCITNQCYRSMAVI